MRQWHQKRHGCSGNQLGSSHSSGGSGFTPSQLYTPSAASQNLPHDGMNVAPPLVVIHSRAATASRLFAGVPCNNNSSNNSREGAT